MNNSFTKTRIRIKLFMLFAVLVIGANVKAQNWPCAQYITRQVGSGSAVKTNISYVYTLGGSAAPVTVTVAKLDTLLNASVIYGGYIWAWKQYTGTSQSGSAGARLIRVNFNNLDSTVTPTVTGYSFPSITMGCNAAFVDPNGIYYVISTATNGASSFVLSRINLATGTPTLLTNLTVNLPSGSTVGSGGLGDMVYTQDSAYVLINNVGLFKFALPSTSTTSVNSTLVGSVNRTVGSLFYINSDPNNIYGYGSTTSSSTQDRILKINKSNGAVTELTTSGIAVSQSDGAGCPSTNFTQPTFFSISGNVYNDANGLRDNTVNGSGTNAGGLTAVLYDTDGNNVVASVAVAANGTYSFPNLNTGNFGVKITTNTVTIGALAPAVLLPSGWVNTGEKLGTGTGSDGTVNGIVVLGTITSNTTNVNFGIEQIPTANAVTAASQVNPGSTVKVSVPTLNGSDPEQGSFPGTGNLDTVIISTLPSNATLYYNNIAVVAGDTIKNYNPTLLTLDPNDGAITASFTYKEVDAALQSSVAATVSMSFTTLSISGNVYNDANGLKGSPANTVDGAGTNASSAIYAQLLNSSNAVIATTAVASNGTYTFAGLMPGTYSVLINNSSSASTATTLPTNWVNTGEFNGTGAGSDGNINGTSTSVTLSTINITNVNFGIEQKPTANAATLADQPNPGGTVKVQAPTLNGSDPEQGSYPGTGNLDTVIIFTLPSNATLYYNNVAVVTGDTIKNYNPTLLTVDPNDGAIAVSFTYKEVDAALQSSAAATASMNFTTLSISGNVYDDANGLKGSPANTVDGVGTNAGGAIYAQLLNSSNAVIATTAVASNGTYTFAGLSGGTYSVLINNSSSASTATTLPTNWVNTGEFIGTGVGSDGTINGTSVSITVSATSVSNVNFGIEQLPTANAVTAASQPNPGGTVKVTVPTLNGADAEQGTFNGTSNLDTVIIRTLPTNGTIYYNNVAVVAGDTIKNYNPTLLTVDPNDGAITVSFTYAEVDAALQSSAAATVSMSFTTLTISGNVYDDANGLKGSPSNTVDGVGTNASGAIYAQLLNNSNAVIATTAVASNGTYSFTGLNGGTYSVLINNSSSASTATTLPTNWVNTGEFIGTGVGSDGTINGTSVSITLSTTSVLNVNFGIEQLPTANAVTAASQTNPGGIVKVTVPTLNGSDPEQGNFTGTGNLDTVIIRTLPSNGTLYYNNVAVVAGDTIKNYNPTLLTVDPNDGAITVSFTYSEVDAALQSSAAASVSMPFGTVSISGNVYDDANALQDAMVNGVGTNAGGVIYAHLLNSSNAVIATTAVASNGTYSFADLNGGTYSVIINNISTASTMTTLPSNWLNTGEFNGTGAGNDGTVNGTSAVITISTSSVTNVNFGIEQLPTANAVTAASQTNPGGTVKVTVPTLNGSDPEQGVFNGTSNLDTVIIRTLPSNGTLYYNNIAVVAGDTIKNYNPTLLTVDPNDGAITVSFTYAEIDAALQSSVAATVTMDFTTVSISGNVFDDANALQDGIVNGAGTNAENNLHAQLLNSSNVVIATTAVASNGTYSFAGLNGGTYTVLINTSSSASTSTTLPTNWINTGEFNGTGVGNDGAVNGTSASITLSTTSVSNVNFGVEQLPTANAVTAASQVNPGGAVKVTVPTLNGNDPEQGVFAGTGNLDTIIIRTLPTNAVLYYNNVAVTAGDTIKNYNPALLMVDPNDGAITVSFTYAEVDAALQSSAAASVNMPFGTVVLSGNVYDDENGLQDGIVNGTGTNAGNTIYAQLLNSSNSVIATTAVASNGSYSFVNLNAGTYSVIINTSSTASTSTTLPTNWLNTGEFNGTGAGSDGVVNGTSASITLSTTNIGNINFGIEQLPTANAVTAASQVNPGGAVKVVVPTLNGSDPEQGGFWGTGNSDTVIIKTLPTNGTLYYNNVAVVAGDTIKNYNPTLLTVDPNDGAITVSFTYAEVDAALQSSAAATVTMDFTTVSISGNVYDDANALQDAIVNGTGTNASGTIYAQLLNSSNVVIATTAVASNGTYSFAGLNGGTYSVIINTSSSASTSTILPTNWINTGEFNGTGVGNDGNVNGTSATITLSTVSVGDVNFGIEQLPTANAVTIASQVNPGGSIKVTVPTLNGSDPEQGSFTGISGLDTVIIKTLPTNGTLYYNNVAVVADDTIKNYNPTLLMIDPNDGAITVSFTYAEIDAALQSSAAASVTMDFTTVGISGNVYDDANALQDAIVNGAGTNAGNTIYAQLLDNNNAVIATTAVASNGTYSFTGLNGGIYSVLINTSSSASASTILPTNWINTGEFNGTGIGNDGNVNGTSASITLSTTSVTNVNFGIEQLPTANDVTAASQVNPGGAIKVTVPTLNGSDPEQGVFAGTGNMDTVIIKTLPTNGTLYYNNVAITTGAIINNYNPALLTLDPNDGAITVSFTYEEVDAALQSSAAATVTMDFTTVSISGNVFDDANALQDGTVNGVGTNAGNTLYAQLLNSSNAVIATTAIAADGTYSFADLNGGTYSVIVNNSSSASTIVTLPTNWINTGEFNGTGAGSDGAVNSTSAIITLSTANVTNVNFGVEQLPTANEVTTASQVNPGGAIKVTVPTLNGSDPEQGNFIGTNNTDTVIIKTLPTNGTLYYNNVAVVAGDTIKNYNPSLLTVDPNDGAITVSFTYAEVDAALQSSAAATVTMDFTTVSISGNVYDDANALQDAIVNGTGTNASGTIYAQLLNSSNVVIATTAVASNGTYSFAGLNGGTYSVIINTSSSASTSTILPTNWINTGEFNGTGVGNDGNVNGISATITLSTASVGDVNFGIEQLPTANAVTIASQVNPGGSIKVTVPTLNGSDPEQGSFTGISGLDTVIIKTLPTNGTLYYNNVAVVAGDTIKNYNPSLLTVDPNDGAITVSFTYAEVDAALQSSAAATVTMDFTTVSISGNVYDDANALLDGIVNGPGTNAGNTLYAHLLNSSIEIAATAIASDGTYSFAGLSGGTYSVLINTSSNSNSGASLPAGWIFTGDHIGTGTGNDGSVNGVSSSITLTTIDIINVNFGIEYLPVANDVTAANQVNPGGSVKVTVPVLNGNDAEDGVYDGTSGTNTVIISSLPTNATLYYNNAAVIAGDTIKNYNPSLLLIDPNNGAITVSFTYAEVDAALQSSVPATVTMDFGTISISGYVFDDGNGLLDGTVNGPGTNADDKVYVLLLDNTNSVLATYFVDNTGFYIFNGLDAGTSYTVSIGQMTDTKIPPYVKTGENLGAGPGNDGTIDGILHIGLISTNVTNANFGIEQIPYADLVIAPGMPNPGGTTKVTVPVLSGGDPEDGIYDGVSGTNTIIIKSLPTNGILYYNGVGVAAGDTIKNYEPSLLTVDPVNGAVTVIFNYSEVDAALQSSYGTTVTMPFTTLTLSGNVFDDANALQDATVNGFGTNAGNTLFAQLLNSSNAVIATEAVAADGTYSFSGLNGGTYTVLINTASSASTSTALPTGWVNTGEFNGVGVGNDGTVNGISVEVILSATSIDNINFGVEQIPTANNVSAPNQVNPGGTVKVTVPTLNGSDAEQGTFDGVSNSDTVIIKTLPTSGTLYYNNVAVVAGDTIKNYDPSLLTVDPNNGAVTVSFTYNEIDAALQSSAPATVTMQFGTLTLTGTVFDDANALTDAIVNGVGVKGSDIDPLTAGTQKLYVQLLNSSNAVIATAVVQNNGTYSFAGLDAGTYSVVINQSAVANSAAGLPSGWMHTGEHLGAASGHDGTVNGNLVSVTLSTTDVNSANLGIQKIPVANSVFAPSQFNPGGTGTVNVPVLNGNDLEDGTYNGFSGTNTIIIQTLPNNGKLYYNEVGVIVGDTIRNYDPSLLTVDPNDGFVNISFNYSEVDAANVASVPANVYIPFGTVLPVIISSFTATYKESKVDVNWSTATEINNSYYQVERSSDGITFAPIGIMYASGSASDYQVADVLPSSGLNYYRIATVEKDGTITYSKVIVVRIDGGVIAVTSVKPNPFISTIDVYVDLPKAAEINVALFDAGGKLVHKNKLMGAKGVNSVNVKDLDKLSKGVYILRVTTGETMFQKKILKN